MSTVFVDVGVSLDGYIAGPNRGPGNPLGDGGVSIHQWMFRTATFVADGIGSALEQAKVAAGRKDVRISGGAATIRQFIEAGLVEKLTLHIAPLLLGTGLRLFDQLGPGQLQLDQTEVSHSALVTHVSYKVVA